MKIFVAGATGVIGRRLVPALIEQGHLVTGIARSQEKVATLGQMGATGVGVDLFEPDALSAAVAGHDVVINMATRIPPGPQAFFPRSWGENDRIRSEGARNLVNAALASGVTRYIQESFAPIYESAGETWIDESGVLRPSSHTRSVLVAEGEAERFARNGGEAIILRFAFFYGADSDLTQQTLDMVRRGWAPSFGAPSDYVSALSHDDAASAVLLALGLPGGVYNVVDDEPLTRRAYFDSLAAELGVAPPRLPPPWLARFLGPIGDIMARSQRMSNRKLKEAGGWSPRHPSVREGWGAMLR